MGKYNIFAHPKQPERNISMPKYIEKIEQLHLPVVPLRGVVAFPSVPLSFEVSDDSSIHAAEAAFETDSFVLLCAVKDLEEEPATYKRKFFFANLPIFIRACDISNLPCYHTISPCCFVKIFCRIGVFLTL